MARFEWIEYKESDKKKEIDEKTKAQPEEYNEEHYLKLAEKAFETGSYSNALRYYSRALNLNTKSKSAWVGQVLCLLALGQYNEAVVWANKGLDFCPDCADMIAAKAYALNRIGKKEEALKESDRSLEYTDKSWFVWLARADILLDKNSPNADHCFMKAIEMSGEDWIAYMMIGASFLSVHNIAKSLFYLQKALVLRNDNPLIYYHLANAYYQSGNYEKSRNYLKGALEFKPDFPEAQVMLEKLSRKSFITKILALLGLKM